MSKSLQIGVAAKMKSPYTVPGACATRIIGKLTEGGDLSTGSTAPPRLWAFPLPHLAGLLCQMDIAGGVLPRV